MRPRALDERWNLARLGYTIPEQKLEVEQSQTCTPYKILTSIVWNSLPGARMQTPEK